MATLRGKFKSIGISLETVKQNTDSNCAQTREALIMGSEFKTINADHLVEEEELPDYRADRFSPARLGDVFQNRYQVLAKLGFVCICGIYGFRCFINCFRAHQYVALKTYVYTSLVHRELPLDRHIARHVSGSTHRGRQNIRKLLDSFDVVGPHSKHAVLVFKAAQISLRDMKTVFQPGGFDEDFVRGAIIELLEALDFIYAEGEIVHTGAVTLLHYLSLVIDPGPHGGDIVPLEYLAPETLLYVGWSCPVDIWSVGLTAWDPWDPWEPKRLFTGRVDDLY
ncbi:protein kinase, putative [Talaromyces stipitatus ATCC 10500]|uniref:non-specific serine/threonine protein kinase n=1 Tax=Talaromyces stipitatus (strain ATCC 10500 / CBS 375.48 / QM 6759 / NRRL 1006) TaxID=441959 RepID=B8MC51_TALSN|nr:protein kinase, putative [Talaromyces stipitatus ATCC 10500]EED18497.1 protein kinase, putative [Talaromyces stipitatus ATCC 10500]